jgi:hypothetical protein
VPLAVLLVGLHLGRRALAARRPAVVAGLARTAPPPAALARAALPAALVAAPWLALNLRLGLFEAANTGAFDPGRAAVVVPALLESLATPEWHGLAWGVLLLPLLAAARTTRWLGLALLLQLGLYLAVYLSAPIDPGYYVRSSFPRLLFHLLPAGLAAAAALAGAAAGGAKSGAAASAASGASAVAMRKNDERT